MLTHQFNPYSACTSILVGKNASADGSTMIGRNEDSRAAWAKKMIIHAHREFEEPQTFKSQNQTHPFTMTLPKIRAKYTATPEWTAEYGLFEEDGINEYGVAMSATESAYCNTRVLAADPYVKDGIGEEAMVTVTLPYIHSAREGVERLGHIIEEHGTYETNGILFSDVNEVWYMETGAGHYWVAQRIPDDAYAVVANQLAIQEIDFSDHDNYLYAKDIRNFVLDNQLASMDNGLNFREVFGTADLSDRYYNTPRVWYGQRCFTPSVTQTPESFDLPFIQRADGLIHIDQVQGYLASHYQGTPFDPVGQGTATEKHQYRPISLAKTQESHVLQLRPDLPVTLSGIHWLAMGVAAESVYVPFYAGATTTPAAYQVATEKYDATSAYWIFKHVGILVDAHYHELHGELQTVQKELAIQLGHHIIVTDQQVAALTGDELAMALTKANQKAADQALNTMQALAADLITKSTDMSPLNYDTDLNL
ncbi:C69 family dipeptidase [Lactiplantibacillus plantarum]|uniref:C69 family dipeptidase n=1 Tax=Lactiplantibacillus plantarum TaxID=1590 RepID=UPI00062DB5CC|nr:C69 family dipeptidase [Lactiplantibacillus plantarum]KLD42566.1 peptidase U34 [Lactiplantibacillus plantarum]KLD59819.1 peptidase U34 [Lactiplantibacillus plantarum]MCG3568656.1 C69 family dipeptidase [Lactiplantibacillus plantarum]MCG3571468.1 C69 family dipeptidase [Lactiplantibacillus plantarum]MEE4647288.1 C69 family dipeptidase [Lactiplantibacillus plantarum]